VLHSLSVIELMNGMFVCVRSVFVILSLIQSLGVPAL